LKISCFKVQVLTEKTASGLFVVLGLSLHHDEVKDKILKAFGLFQSD